MAAHEKVAGQAAASDYDLFLGVWRVEDFKDGGRPNPLDDLRFVFSSTGGRGHVELWDRDDGELEESGTYVIDETKRPKTIDLVGLGAFAHNSNNDPRSLGIYEFVGTDRLRLCLSEKLTDGRPTKFASEPQGSVNDSLLELRLVTKDVTALEAFDADAPSEKRDARRLSDFERAHFGLRIDKCAQCHDATAWDTGHKGLGDQFRSNTCTHCHSRFDSLNAFAQPAGKDLSIAGGSNQTGIGDRSQRLNQASARLADNRETKTLRLKSGKVAKVRSLLTLAYLDKIENGQLSIQSDKSQNAIVLLASAELLDEIGTFISHLEKREERAEEPSLRSDSADGAAMSANRVYQGKSLYEWLQKLKGASSLGVDGRRAIELLRGDLAPDNLNLLIRDWAAVLARERDPNRLAVAVQVVCALAGNEYSGRALDAVSALIEIQPERGELSIYNNGHLIQHATESLRGLNEDVLQARMSKEIADGNSQLRWFALQFCVASHPAPAASVIAASRDKSPHVRKRALEILASVYGEDDTAVERIRELLADAAVADQAAELLVTLDPHSDKLLDYLTKRANQSNSVATQIWAVQRLKTAASLNPRAREKLIDQLEDEDWGNEPSILGTTGSSSYHERLHGSLQLRPWLVLRPRCEKSEKANRNWLTLRIG